MKLCQSLSCRSSQAPCVSVSSLCWLSHSSPLVGLSSGASHSLPFDCHGDTHLHSIILSLFYLSLHFLGEPSALLVKHRLVRGAALDTQISSGAAQLGWLWLSRTPQSLRLQHSNLTFLQPGPEVLLLSCLRVMREQPL